MRRPGGRFPSSRCRLPRSGRVSNPPLPLLTADAISGGAMTTASTLHRFGLAVLVLMALPLLASCGGSSKDDAQAANAPPAPVEELYNNGIDALNAQRYATATD